MHWIMIFKFQRKSHHITWDLLPSCTLLLPLLTRRAAYLTMWKNGWKWPGFCWPALDAAHGYVVMDTEQPSPFPGSLRMENAAQQVPPSWLFPPGSTWEYLHLWHLMLLGSGREGRILCRWLRMICCTSAGSDSRCSLPKVTVVCTTTEGPISGDSEREEEREEVLLKHCLFIPAFPTHWQLCPWPRSQ